MTSATDSATTTRDQERVTSTHMEPSKNTHLPGGLTETTTISTTMTGNRNMYV